MATKVQIIEYAKNLYLTMDEHGKKKYTLKDISKELKKKFKKTIDFSTVSLWSRKYNWDLLTQEIKNHAIAEVITRTNEKEEAVKEAVQDFYAGIAKDNAQIREYADFLILMRLQYEATKIRTKLKNKDPLTDEDFTFDTDKLNRMAERATGVLIDKKTPQLQQNTTMDETEIDEKLKALTKKLGL